MQSEQVTTPPEPSDLASLGEAELERRIAIEQAALSQALRNRTDEVGGLGRMRATNADLGRVRKSRERAAELRAEIEEHESALALLQRALTAAQQTAKHETLEAMRAASEQAAQLLRSRVALLQRAVDALPELALQVRTADIAFSRSLSSVSDGNFAAGITPVLNRLIGLRLHMLTDGCVRAASVIESSFELRQSGRADLMVTLENIIVPAMRCYASPTPEPPPKAA